MNEQQLNQLITKKLRQIELYSVSAVNLLMGTAAQESRLGHYIHQIHGPAMGVFQIEKATFNGLVKYVMHHPGLDRNIRNACNIERYDFESLEYNLALSICFARIKYYTIPERLPKSNDFEGLAKYWKKYYNTRFGKGTVSEFLKNYSKYVEPIKIKNDEKN